MHYSRNQCCNSTDPRFPSRPGGGYITLKPSAQGRRWVCTFRVTNKFAQTHAKRHLHKSCKDLDMSGTHSLARTQTQKHMHANTRRHKSHTQTHTRGLDPK
jgi:hypothetical protein